MSFGASLNDKTAVQIGFWLLDSRKAASVDESKVICLVLTVVGSKDRIVPPFSVRKIAAKYKATHNEIPAHAHWLLGNRDGKKSPGI